MKFSRFTAFGHFGFSGGQPEAYEIYEQSRRNLGVDQNFPDDENVDGKLFADAMTIASVRNSITRAFNQSNPLKATDFLEMLEWEHGVVPLPTQSVRERQIQLANIVSLNIDGLFSTISQELKDLLGDDLVFYRTVRYDELTSRDDFGAGDVNRTNYPGWDVPIRIEKLSWAVAKKGLALVITDKVFGSDEHRFKKGQVVLVNPGHNARSERCVVDYASGDEYATSQTGHSYLMLKFKYPHDAGTLITSGHYPGQFSNKRRHIICLKIDAARSANVRHSVDLLMKRLVRGTSVWQICEETDESGVTGPFTIDSSHLGLATISEVGP